MPKGHYNAQKTHCPHGHRYTPANTYVRRYQARNARWYALRECRACGRLKTAARYAACRALLGHTVQHRDAASAGGG